MLLAVFLLHIYAVEIRLLILLILGNCILKIYYVVFVPGIDNIPGILLVSPGSARHYGLKQMVEPILPYVGKIDLSACPQSINQKIHLRKVEGVVGKGIFGISDD